jgi:hypothetical protein
MANFRFDPDDHREQLESMTSVSGLSTGKISNVCTHLGNISLVNPSNFEEINKITAREKVKGDTVSVAVIPSYFSSVAWGSTSPLETPSVRQEYISLRNYRTNIVDFNNHHVIAELFKLELIKLLDKLPSNRIVISNEITIEDLESVSNILIKEGHNFNDARWFSWLISDYRSVSILFDTYDVKIYQNDKNGFAYYVNPDKVAVLYTNSNSYLPNGNMRNYFDARFDAKLERRW